MSTTMDESRIREAVSNQANNEFHRRWDAYCHEKSAAKAKLLAGMDYTAVQQMEAVFKAGGHSAWTAKAAAPLALRDIENRIVLDLVAKVALVDELLRSRDEYPLEQQP